MQNKTLTDGLNIIIQALGKSELPIDDKIELMINISKFFEDYKKNIKILRKELKK